MKNLKNKVYYTILAILTFSVLTFILIYNVQNYLQAKNDIENNFRMSDDNFNDFKNNNVKPINDDIRFMDYYIYEVILDSTNEIIETKNRSNNNISNEEISNIAQNILHNDKNQIKYIGNLYTNDYSYFYTSHNSLIILDNNSIRSNLLSRLRFSILIFAVLEVIIITISKIITDWIIKPVKTSFEKQKEFIADASHELKTPLSVIMASSEALMDNPNEVKWLNNIQNEADRMNKLITNLLDLAKSENNSITLNKGNISEIVELSVLTFEAKAFEKNLHLDSNIEKDLYIAFNEDMIKQLLEILLDNAIKHSYSKETINVILTSHNKYIELLVQNRGDAIPKGEEEKIFERFYRVDKSRNRNDNRYGLGLAIAKNIVMIHHGDIKAYSIGGITTFKILLKK